MLSVGAGLLIRSFVRLTQTDTGFRAEQVVNAMAVLPSGRYGTGAQVKAFYRDAVAAVAALPGVVSAGAATDRPLNVRERRVFTPDSSAQQTLGPHHREHVDRRPLLRGAWHSAPDRAVLHRR